MRTKAKIETMEVRAGDIFRQNLLIFFHGSGLERRIKGQLKVENEGFT